MPARAAVILVLAAAACGPKLSPEVILDTGLPLRPPLVDMGVAPAGDEIRGLVSFKLRERDTLDAEIAELYRPESPTFRQYMSVDQFMATHGPLEEDIAVVSQWFTDAGLGVGRIAKNRMLFQITARVVLSSILCSTVGRFARLSASRRILAQVSSAASGTITFSAGSSSTSRCSPSSNTWADVPRPCSS